MDGFTRKIFENYFSDPTKSDEDKQDLARSIQEAYGSDPDPDGAEVT